MTLIYHPRGFTLVELLVVVTVIIVLAAMLLPAMESAVTAGQRAKCVTNIHTQHVAIMQYAIDNRGWFAPGKTGSDSPDFHRTFWGPSDRTDRVAPMRDKYVPNGDVLYCPLLAHMDALFAGKDAEGRSEDDQAGWGGWNTDAQAILTPYMWLPGFETMASLIQMLNGEPEPPLNTQDSSARHTFITHRLDYYTGPSVQDLGHFGAGYFQAAVPYDSHKTSEMPVGTGDGGAFVRTRDQMNARMVIDRTNPTYPNPADPGSPGAYFW